MDEYTGNEELAGTYLYRLQFQDQNGNTFEKEFLIDVQIREEAELSQTIVRNVVLYGLSVSFLLFVGFKKYR